PSRMLKCWKDVPGYNLFVREKWNTFQVEDWGGYVLKEKLKMMNAALKDWHKMHVQNVPSRIETLKDQLSLLDQRGEEVDLSGEELAELHGVTADLHSLSHLQASISWQQSRSLWLKEGDANSKYFHSVLASCSRRNAISVIHVEGASLEDVAPIRQAVFSHFASHFKSSTEERPRVDNLQFKRLTYVEGSSLTKPFTETEVKSAVWDCDSYKSPGPDGINFSFIKDFWAELRGDVMCFISDFHRNGKLAKGINSTFIALIPKIDSPQRLNDFRPISLVGSLYKILAKVLANRLRFVIGSVISESQTAFVKNSQILDGILIANEVVDEARKSKKELMLFKVDFEKAYDSVDWGYLDKVMERMSFPTLWRKWIKECVGTATASVLVNGSPTAEFPLERGLRQGDPLSPILFLLAAEGHNVLMEAMVRRNLFTGFRVGVSDSLSVSHLQFADDTLLLGEKSWANVRALRAVLVLFESLSGLKVNFHKSMLVGVNIRDSWLDEASSALCCRVGKTPFLYLGLPIGGDSRRLVFWEPVLARLKNRLSGWKSRFLSFGGRLVLLKSVLTSLPVYALSFFKAPSGIISSIESILIKFFWGGCEDFRKIAWVNWKTICLRKEYGGLGVRRLREFNLALLGKWCWRMLVDREGMWFRVLAARYGVEGGRLRVGGRHGSMWWREIASIREGDEGSGGSWFGDHVVRRVGDGSDTLFWTDPWLGETPFRERFGRLFDLAETKQCTVAELSSLGWGIDGEAWVWRRPLRAWEEELLRECQILLSNISLQAQSPDRWQW
ncbi:cysteine-rich receptor-like protein kinase, partial [Trifolium pratense]